MAKAQEPQPKTGPEITFVDFPEGEHQSKKESFINEKEAQNVLDYYIGFLQESAEMQDQSLYLTSPFRTQAQLIKSTIADMGPDEIF